MSKHVVDKEFTARELSKVLDLSYEDILKYKNHRKVEHMLYEKITKVYPNKKGGSVWRALWNMGKIIH